MTNKLLLTSILAFACWANAFAQLTLPNATYGAANPKSSEISAGLTACGCTSILVNGSITLGDDWNLGNISITVITGGSINFSANQITLGSGGSIIINPKTNTTALVASTNGSNDSKLRIIIGSKTYVSTDLSGIITAGGANQLGVLPVELTYFNGTATETGNVLKWHTSSETNFVHFDIERSTNGQIFTSVSQIKAKGSNSTYTFGDENPAHNTYYRLKIVDNDGSFSYSNVISVQTERRYTAWVYPTIAEDFVNIETTTPEQIRQVSIFDRMGKAVMVANALETNRLDVSALATGMYLVQWQIGSEIQSAKIIKR